MEMSGTHMDILGTITPRFAVNALCVTFMVGVLLLPDQRTPENFRKLFAERNMELMSITPAATGCYRSGAYHYAARKTDGTVENGRLCISKSMYVFQMKPE